MRLRGKFIGKYFLQGSPFSGALLFFILLTAPLLSVAQTTDTLQRADTVINLQTISSPDSLDKKDSSGLDTLGIIISPDALDDIVKASAKDSAIMEMDSGLFYLYGNAKVEYTNLTLEAGRIEYAQESSVVTATPLYDSSGLPLGKPTFTQAQEQFTYDSLQYNFKSQRAVVRNARTQYGEGFVLSEQVKRNPDQSIYGWRNVYTTCNLDTPHFGIRARKIRVIPSRVIASGAANLMIEDVPTPLYLPFGIFPISQRQRSGFVLPTYSVETVRGLGLLGGGYYFNMGHFADLLLTTNFYSKGSWGLIGVTNYAERYRYNGNLRVSYAYNKQGEIYEQNGGVIKEFFVNWSHQKDPKSRPGINFNANVNLGSSNYFANNSYNANQILNNQYSSNITFQKIWQDKPFSLTVSATHNQNTATREMRVNLPDVQFFVNPINPFQRKEAVGLPRWYEKITVGYSFNAKNGIVFYDSSFSLNKLSLSDFNNGIVQNIPINATYNILKFLNLSLAANYNEFWLTDRLYTNYSPLLQGIDSLRERGFFTSRDFNFSSSLNTRIFGLKMFRGDGAIKGIRHEVKPRVSFNYRPDFGIAPFNYGYRSLMDSMYNYEMRSPYISSPVSYPALGRQGTVVFGVGNNLQMKVRNAKDTATGTRNVSIFDDVSLSAGYNLAADSFQWQPLDLSFRTNILDKISLSGGANWDFYEYDQNLGKRLQQTLMSRNNGFARFNSAGVAVQASFHSKKDVQDKPIDANDESVRLLRYGAYEYVDFNIPWNFNIAYSLDVQKIYRLGKDTLRLNQTLTLNGDFNLTERWKVALSTGYNFDEKSLTLTSIDLYRDLHCWEMRLGTIPFGRNKSFNFTINVKATVLQDLKLVRRRNFRDAIY